MVKIWWEKNDGLRWWRIHRIWDDLDMITNFTEYHCHDYHIIMKIHNTWESANSIRAINSHDLYLDLIVLR